MSGGNVQHLYNSVKAIVDLSCSATSFSVVYTTRKGYDLAIKGLYRGNTTILTSKTMYSHELWTQS